LVGWGGGHDDEERIKERIRKKGGGKKGVERKGEKKKRKNEGESKVGPAIVAVCANLAQILVQKKKKMNEKSKKLRKNMRSPEDKWPFIFRRPPIFSPSPQTVTSTKNMGNCDITRNNGFVYISVWPKCVVRTQLTS